MASSWYPTTGIPADTVGSDGDFARDAVNRIDWGPKGRVTAGSWAGTAIAINGPTGQSILSGVGAPGSQLGNNGQSYFDPAAGTTYLKSNNAWAAAGTLIGPQGIAGPSLLTSQSAGLGQTVATTATLSSTPTVLTYPGQTLVPITAFNYGTALMGAIIQNQSTATAVFSLMDVTANTTVYSYSVAASTTAAPGQFSLTQYPMPQGHNYQWTMTGSAAAAGSFVTPIYLMPAASPAFNISNLPMCGRSSTTTTYGGTYNALYVGASTLSYTFKTTKACSLYSVNCYNQTNASITFGFANYTANNFLWNLGVVPANSTAQFGPYAVGTYAFTPGSAYYWSAAGSGTGAAYLDSQVIFSAA